MLETVLNLSYIALFDLNVITCTRFFSVFAS